MITSFLLDVLSIQQELTSCPDLNRFNDIRESSSSILGRNQMGWSQVALRKLRLLLFYLILAYLLSS